MAHTVSPIMPPYELRQGLPDVEEKEIYCSYCRGLKWHTTRLLSSVMTPQEIFEEGKRNNDFYKAAQLMNNWHSYHLTSTNYPPCIRENTCRICGNKSFDLCINAPENAYALYRIHPLLTPSSIPAPNPDIPEECQAIYEEAAQIFSLSPRASAVLLRLCLQNLLETLNISGTSINEKIKNVVRAGVPEYIQQFMDTCRYYGNQAAHFLQIDPEETRDTAEYLFTVINTIAEILITTPAKAESSYEKLPQSIRDKIRERDLHK